jgi:hypothetical protein
MRVCPRNKTEINHSLGVLTGHLGTQGWQGSGPERYNEQGSETSTKCAITFLTKVFN